MKKNCMFQYSLKPSKAPLSWEIVNTDLITREEANKLWDKYQPDFTKKLEAGLKPQMTIWADCKHNRDYRNAIKSLDYENVE